MCPRSRLVRAVVMAAALALLAACGGSSSGGTTGLCCLGDGPECTCFVDGGAWDPAPAFIQDVARATIGTVDSCASHGGKPYYQMRLGENSPAAAQELACCLDVLLSIFTCDRYDREDWCSEAVSYWHREARIPYATGYRNSSWMFDWQLTHTNAIRAFYETEEDAGGRGRWVDGTDIDYEANVLGVTTPVPGAYMMLRRWDGSSFRDRAHSLMVDEMTVWQNAAGEASRIEITLLEGNAGLAVKDDRVITDVLDVTALGTSDVDSRGRRIVGFGVDLDSSGTMLYDASRLHVIPSLEPAPLVGAPGPVPDETWDQFYAPRIPALAAFARNLGNGPGVQSNNPALPFSGIPDGHSTTWDVPADVDQQAPQGFQVDVDLLAEHPIPVDVVLLRWRGAALPRGYVVQWAGADGVYHAATVPDLTEDDVPLDPNGRAASAIPVTLDAQGVAVRYLRLVFPPGTFGGATTLEELTFNLLWGEDDDEPVD